METLETKPRRVAADEARVLLAEQEQSGLTMAAFARSKGVQPWTLYNARAQARKKASRLAGASFSPIHVTDQPESVGSSSGPIELVLPSGLTLRIAVGFDEVALRRLLGVLAAC